MNIYVIGTGGVGGFFGGLLAKAGENVVFVCRGDNYKAIKEKGLKIKSVIGDFCVEPAKVVDSIGKIENPDLIIFAVKTYDTEAVAKELISIINKDTIIITFQNGIENDLVIKKITGSNNVYPGVAYVISARTKPGMIEQTGGLRKLIFGDRDNSENYSLREVEKVMRTASIDASLSEDITRDLWKKYMFIVAFSGMTAVCRSPIGKVLADPITLDSYKRCVREAIKVAKAHGVAVASDALENIMTISKNTASGSKSSLLVDIENGRKNEIETINGTLVKLARRYKIDAPVNELIYGAIKLILP